MIWMSIWKAQTVQERKSDDLDEHLEDTKGIEEETLYDCTFQW